MDDNSSLFSYIKLSVSSLSICEKLHILSSIDTNVPINVLLGFDNFNMYILS